MMKSKGIPAYIALSCLFAALCCTGALLSISVPIGPVPLVLTNLFAVLGGLLLGPMWGGVACALYISIGALGFPVFSGGRGGLAHLFGPLSGYLIGYILAAILAGLLARRRGIVTSAIGSVIGFSVILVSGVIGLAAINHLSLSKAFAIGLLPFLLGDAIKAVVAALIAAKLGPFVDSLTGAREAHG